MMVDQETSGSSTDKSKAPAKSYIDAVKNLAKKMASTTITSIVEKGSSFSVQSHNPSHNLQELQMQSFSSFRSL
jgi:hypothetical protein